jgi:hypothetical protein
MSDPPKEFFARIEKSLAKAADQRPDFLARIEKSLAEIERIRTVGLPTFDSLPAAEEFYYDQRDRVLREFPRTLPPSVNLDYSPESLKRLEAWYFTQGDRDRHSPICLGIGYYFGEMVCRDAGFEWCVFGYKYAENVYEIAVKTEGFRLLMTRGQCPVELRRNPDMDLFYRDYTGMVAASQDS